MTTDAALAEPGDETLHAEEREQQAPEQQDAPETDPALASIASAMGWRPLDQFDGDPKRWKPADKFIRDTAERNTSLREEVKSLKDQVQRVHRVAETTIAENRRKALSEARAELARAAAEGDADALRNAQDNYERVAAQPADPGAAADRDAFIRKNPWFESDSVAQGIALGAAQKVANSGGSAQEQFAAAEKEVRKRMPELFADGGEIAPAPRPAKSPPAMQGGTRAPAPAPKEKGWGDIPAAVRGEADKMVHLGMTTRESYAKIYWAEQAKKERA